MWECSGNVGAVVMWVSAVVMWECSGNVGAVVMWVSAVVIVGAVVMWGVSRENWSGQKLVRADHFSLPKLVRPRTTFGYQKWSGLPKVVRGVTDG